MIDLLLGSGNSDQASKHQTQGISSTFNHRSAINWMVQFGYNFEVGYLGRCRIMIRWGFPQMRVNFCSLWGRSWHFRHQFFVIQILSNFTVANNLYYWLDYLNLKWQHMFIMQMKTTWMACTDLNNLNVNIIWNLSYESTNWALSFYILMKQAQYYYCQPASMITWGWLYLHFTTKNIKVTTSAKSVAQ